MSPPLVMDEKYASLGMDIIEEAISEVEREFGY
jgi:4-aminobutyrate aminotransferase/4-aminobutyrate aminotransferase/(S)-3-amino-2-methylpropionate transaminase